MANSSRNPLDRAKQALTRLLLQLVRQLVNPEATAIAYYASSILNSDTQQDE
jgi:hypothetical protein